MVRLFVLISICQTLIWAYGPPPPSGNHPAPNSGSSSSSCGPAGCGGTSSSINSQSSNHNNGGSSSGSKRPYWWEGANNPFKECIPGTPGCLDGSGTPSSTSKFGPGQDIVISESHSGSLPAKFDISSGPENCRPGSPNCGSYSQDTGTDIIIDIVGDEVPSTIELPTHSVGPSSNVHSQSPGHDLHKNGNLGSAPLVGDVRNIGSSGSIHSPAGDGSGLNFQTLPSGQAKLPGQNTHSVSLPSGRPLLSNKPGSRRPLLSNKPGSGHTGGIQSSGSHFPTSPNRYDQPENTGLPLGNSNFQSQPNSFVSGQPVPSHPNLGISGFPSHSGDSNTGNFGSNQERPLNPNFQTYQNPNVASNLGFPQNPQSPQDPTIEITFQNEPNNIHSTGPGGSQSSFPSHSGSPGIRNTDSRNPSLGPHAPNANGVHSGHPASTHSKFSGSSQSKPSNLGFSSQPPFQNGANSVPGSKLHSQPHASNNGHSGGSHSTTGNDRFSSHSGGSNIDHSRPLNPNPERYNPQNEHQSPLNFKTGPANIPSKNPNSPNVHLGQTGGNYPNNQPSSSFNSNGQTFGRGTQNGAPGQYTNGNNVNKNRRPGQFPSRNNGGTSGTNGQFPTGSNVNQNRRPGQLPNLNNANQNRGPGNFPSRNNGNQYKGADQFPSGSSGNINRRPGQFPSGNHGNQHRGQDQFSSGSIANQQRGPEQFPSGNFGNENRRHQQFPSSNFGIQNQGPTQFPIKNFGNQNQRPEQFPRRNFGNQNQGPEQFPSRNFGNQHQGPTQFQNGNQGFPSSFQPQQPGFPSNNGGSFSNSGFPNQPVEGLPFKQNEIDPQDLRPISTGVSLSGVPMMMMPMGVNLIGGSCSAGSYCVEANTCNPYTGFIIRNVNMIAAVRPNQPQVPLLECLVPAGGISDGVCCQEAHPLAGTGLD